MRNQTIIVDINKEVCKILRYKQYDNNNLLQIIVEENYKKINIEEYIGFAFFELPSGLIIKKDCIIQENVITITLDNSILSEQGKTLLDLTLSDGEKIFTLFRINLIIEGTIDRDEAVIIEAGWDIVAEVAKFDLAERERVSNEEERVQYEEQRREKENERLQSEVNRKNKESERIVNENTRLSNENNRVAEENIRKSNEQVRVNAENTRKSNEQTRVSEENIRISNETERQQNETDRQSEEEKRISNENRRITNEETATQNESTRENNEQTRINAESTRVTEENTRKSNEQTRVNAENTRKNNEQARVDAENTRVTEHNAREVRLNNVENDIESLRNDLYHEFTPLFDVGSGNIGRYEFPNGLIIQWGLIGFDTQVLDIMLTFAKPFPNHCFNIFVSVLGSEHNFYCYANGHVIDREKARIVVSNNTAGSHNEIYWFSIGY